MVSAERDENFRKGVTPHVFTGGPVPIRLDFRQRWNDGLRKGTEFNAASRGQLDLLGLKNFPNSVPLG